MRSDGPMKKTLSVKKTRFECLACGRTITTSLEKHWQNSPTCEEFFIRTQDGGVVSAYDMTVKTPTEVNCP
jgi:hypothetical protein